VREMFSLEFENFDVVEKWWLFADC
jgi:hypothetical protein